MVAVALLPGCADRVGGFKNERDRLAYELHQTQQALDAVRRERTELRAKLRELATTLDATSGEAAADVVEAMPRAAELEFERLTSLVDRDDRPGYESIDVYLRPLDGRGRFVQAAGTLRVQASLLPSDARGERTLLVERTLGPREIRNAYRSTLLSVHYSIPLVLDEPLPIDRLDRPGNGELLVIARFDDAITGLTHTATRKLR